MHVSILQHIYNASPKYLQAKLCVLNTHTWHTFSVPTRSYRQKTGRYQRIFNSLQKRFANFEEWLKRGLDPNKQPGLLGVVQDIRELACIQRCLWRLYLKGLCMNGYFWFSSPRFRQQFIARFPALRNDPFVHGRVRSEMCHQVSPSEELIEAFVVYAHKYLKAAQKQCRLLGWSLFPTQAQASLVAQYMRACTKDLRRALFFIADAKHKARSRRLHRRAMRRSSVQVL